MKDCIKCTRKIDENGYARVTYKGKTECEHRMVFRESYPEIYVVGKIIHHECRNKWCVNPKHLVAITRKEHSAEHGLSGWAKIHSEKTHCKNGHPLDRRNKNQRYCSICRKVSANKYASTHREKSRDWKREWRKKIGIKPRNINI